MDMVTHFININYIEERTMEGNAILCDNMALWEKQQIEGMKAYETIDFKIYLKINIFFPFSENDTDTITMTYIQVINILSYYNYL